MSLLATLRAKRLKREVATLTVATVATPAEPRAPTVARVATVTVASAEKLPPAVALDSDRWCWPNSPAMNTREIDTFTARLALFTDKGESLDDAERLADRLVIRDREGDDRRLCLECAHLQGYGRWRCGNWQAADVARQGLAGDLVLMLQRCRGYSGALKNRAIWLMISENPTDDGGLNNGRFREWADKRQALH